MAAHGAEGNGEAASAPVAGEETPEAAQAELETLRAKVARHENAITWETSCLACARVLDSAAAETFRREAAEAKLAGVRELAARWTALPAVEDLRFIVPADYGRAVLAILGAESEGAPVHLGGGDE